MQLAGRSVSTTPPMVVLNTAPGAQDAAVPWRTLLQGPKPIDVGHTLLGYQECDTSMSLALLHKHISLQLDSNYW